MMSKLKLLVLASALAITACDDDKDTISSNLSKAESAFELERRIVIYSDSGKEILTIGGKCSVGNDWGQQLVVTCKTGENEFKRHYLGLADNTAYFVEQINSSIFKGAQ